LTKAGDVDHFAEGSAQMSIIDVVIPMVFGILMVACPRLFVKKGIPELAAETRSANMRRIGYLLLGASAFFLVIELVE
jgi:hypothetical protein